MKVAVVGGTKFDPDVIDAYLDELPPASTVYVTDGNKNTVSNYVASSATIRGHIVITPERTDFYTDAAGKNHLPNQQYYDVLKAVFPEGTLVIVGDGGQSKQARQFIKGLTETPMYYNPRKKYITKLPATFEVVEL